MLHIKNEAIKFCDGGKMLISMKKCLKDTSIISSSIRANYAKNMNRKTRLRIIPNVNNGYYEMLEI